MPWTVPLQRDEAEGLVGVVRTAAIIVILAVSGMRSSEVMELRVGSRQPPQEAAARAWHRHRLASNVVKGQPLGGTQDEWVVIEPVYQAIGLAEQLHDDPRDGAPLFGRFDFRVRYQWFRSWVNGPAGQRLGTRPHPRRPGDAEDAQANTGDRACLPAWRPPRSKTSPKAHFSRNNRRLRVPPGRRPGRAPSRGQQARGRPQP